MPEPDATEPAPISQLRYRDHFVRALPGDPSTDNRPRPVLGACYSRVEPTAVPEPKLLAVVPEVARLLDLSPVETTELTGVLSGNRVLPGMAPYAACYGGYQFGQWAGQLGDGRAITLGEVENSAGQSFEVQLKGAGKTPYSRHADGRAVLRSSLREFVCSEAMHHLGVPTTRALSLALTGDRVVRDLLYDGHPEFEPAAVVCRVAPSFLRFGNFEIHTARNDFDTLLRLVRFTIERHFPQFSETDDATAVADLFEEVCKRTARLVVEWMRVGFVHGVLNTDNMSILGLTIDYGPFAFLDAFDPDWTPNITDSQTRRYRFANQPRIAQWNLAQLGRALSPLVDDVAVLERGLTSYAEELAAGQRSMLLGKLGLAPQDAAQAASDDLLATMFSTLTVLETDMTLFFRRLAALPLSAATSSHEAKFDVLRDAYYAPETANTQQLVKIGAWLERYLARVRVEGVSDEQRRERMFLVNPLYVPRNYLLQQVIDKTASGERAPLAELLDVLRRPYHERPGREEFAAKRPDWARDRPGCSMLSCSS
jgi:uncharacterized protein YdiU (UPF0061 family)